MFPVLGFRPACRVGVICSEYSWGSCGAGRILKSAKELLWGAPARQGWVPRPSGAVLLPCFAQR